MQTQQLMPTARRRQPPCLPSPSPLRFVALFFLINPGALRPGCLTGVNGAGDPPRPINPAAPRRGQGVLRDEEDVAVSQGSSSSGLTASAGTLAVPPPCRSPGRCSPQLSLKRCCSASWHCSGLCGTGENVGYRQSWHWKSCGEPGSLWGTGGTMPCCGAPGGLWSIKEGWTVKHRESCGALGLDCGALGGGCTLGSPGCGVAHRAGTRSDPRQPPPLCPALHLPSPETPAMGWHKHRQPKQAMPPQHSGEGPTDTSSSI